MTLDRIDVDIQKVKVEYKSVNGDLKSAAVGTVEGSRCGRQRQTVAI